MRVQGQVSVNKFVSLGFLWNMSFNKAFATPKIHVSDLEDFKQQDIDAFIKISTIKIEEISDNKNIRSYPIIETKVSHKNIYVRSLEKLLHWRITSGLYYDIIGKNTSTSSNLIANSFERYILDLCQAKYSNLTVSRAFNYNNKNKPRCSPDNLIHSHKAVQYLIECKAVKLPHAVQTSTSDSAIRNRVVEA
jgi:hypothetical protein